MFDTKAFKYRQDVTQTHTVERQCTHRVSETGYPKLYFTGFIRITMYHGEQSQLVATHIQQLSSYHLVLTRN